MPVTLENKLVVAISSRALFKLDDSNSIFETEGVRKYTEYQIAHEDEVLEPGVAFPLINRLLNLRYPGSNENAVEVILVSKNDANTGLRVFNSIEHHKLNITRAAFTRGRAPHPYLGAFKADLFLSANPQDVHLALKHGYASASILTGIDFQEEDKNEIRIAFDGDAVIFSDESERIYQEKGLDEFKKNETEKSEIPLGPGPFKAFLEALNRIQKAYDGTDLQPIRTALVTARNAPSHKRAVKTLRSWEISIDEAFFMGGLDKTPILEQFRPHIFFDDHRGHCEAAAKVVPTAQVPSSIRG